MGSPKSTDQPSDDREDADAEVAEEVAEPAKTEAAKVEAAKAEAAKAEAAKTEAAKIQAAKTAGKADAAKAEAAKTEAAKTAGKADAAKAEAAKTEAAKPAGKAEAESAKSEPAKAQAAKAAGNAEAARVEAAKAETARVKADKANQEAIEKERRRERRRVVGRRLDAVAQGLAAALMLALIVVGAVALVNGRVSNSLSSDPLPWYVAAILASVAVFCSVLALAFRPNKSGIKRKVSALFTGSASFVFALVFIVASLVDPPGGSGRPTISGITVSGAHPTTLAFTVSADGIQTGSHVSVVVRASTQAVVSMSSPTADPIYAGILRPDGEGAVEQQISLEFVQGPARYVSIFASGRETDSSEVCTDDLEKESACSTVQLPPDP